MGILFENAGVMGWVIWFIVLIGLMGLNELARAKKWSGILLFIALPVFLTIFVWPNSAAMGNEFGTGNWFVWVKTYSALAGCIIFMGLRYFPKLQSKKWYLALPAAILAINILEAAVRDFQVFSFGAWDGKVIDYLWTMSGSWNIMNGIAGLLNALAICGWAGIYISKDKTKDMIWPDMIWPWIIAYDLWNFAYVYNCIADHSFYAGFALLLSCTIPAFFIKKGAWLQHRGHTLAFWAMFVMTIPQFAEKLAKVPTTHNPKAFFIVSLVSLTANVALVGYQAFIIIKRKKNPLKDELYADTKAYKQIVEANPV